MNRDASLAIALLACAGGPANAQGVVPGIYGNVTLSEESGDLGGVELELIGTGADARVEFVTCEGWCNEIRRAPVEFTEDGFLFEFVESCADQDCGPVSDRTSYVVVERSDAGVTISIAPGYDLGWAVAYELKPIDRRFGLEIASDDD